MEKWISGLGEGKPLWVICQIGAGILVATKIGIVGAIVLEVAVTMLIIGAYAVWEPELPFKYRSVDAERYSSIDADAVRFGRKILSKRYTKAQLGKEAYDILERYREKQYRDDPNGLRGIIYRDDI
jgi:hypothetical protein